MYNQVTMSKSVKVQTRTPGSGLNYVCRFCHKSFVHESRYLIHECKQMKRDKELKSPVGQAALQYYHVWMRTMKKKLPESNSFLNSNYFRTFINFVNFTKQVDLPLPEKFIWLMVQKDFLPTLWTSDDAYTIYLEYLDKKVPPIEQALLSVKTLMTLADKEGVDPSEVFSKLTAPDVIHMLRTRKLSPWLLLFSVKFKQFFVDKTTPEQKIIINNMIRADYWGEKKQEHAESITEIKKLIKELGI